MFCNKCGSQLLEGAEFCQKCGARQIKDETVSQAPVIPISEPQMPIQSAPNSIYAKKKPKMILTVGGAIVVIILATVLIFILGYNNYIESVKSGEVLLESSVTYDDLFSKYLVSPEWKENPNALDNDGESHIVTVSGDVRNTTDNLYLMLMVMDSPSDPDTILLSPMALGINDHEISDETEIEAFLTFMVAMYEDGSDDISELLLGDQQQSGTDSTGVTLTETYSNEAEGVSFKYPSTWQIIEDSDNFLKVSLLADSHVTFDANLTSDLLNVLSSDKATLQETFNENSDITNRNITDLSDTQIGSISYKKLQYESRNFLDIDIVTTEYWYVIGEDIYTIRCSCPKTSSTTYEPIFNAMIESYTINNSDGSGGTGSEAGESTGEILYDGIPVLSLFDMSLDDVQAHLGIADYEEIVDPNSNFYRYDYNGMSLYGYPLQAEMVFSFEADPSVLTVDGVALNQIREGIIASLGEPVSEYDDRGYGMVYSMGELEMYVNMMDADSPASSILIKRVDAPAATIDDISSGFAYVNTPDGSPLRLREGPGTDYNVLMEIPNGGSVYLEDGGNVDGWVNVSASTPTGKEVVFGWVSAEYLTAEYGGASGSLSADDALQSVVNWLSTTQITGYDLLREDEITIEGEAYYNFDLRSQGAGVSSHITSICVNQTTGELLSYDWVFETYEPLEEWYASVYN